MNKSMLEMVIEKIEKEEESREENNVFYFVIREILESIEEENIENIYDSLNEHFHSMCIGRYECTEFIAKYLQSIRLACEDYPFIFSEYTIENNIIDLINIENSAIIIMNIISDIILSEIIDTYDYDYNYYTFLKDLYFLIDTFKKY